jgi:hypothetical protein
MKRAGDSGAVARKSTICPAICPLGCALVVTPVLTVALLTRFTYGGRQAGFYRRRRPDVIVPAATRVARSGCSV